MMKKLICSAGGLIDSLSLSRLNSRRVIRARVEIEFFATDGLYLEVDAIAPEERWTVIPTTDTETTTRGGQLNLGASGVPFLEAGATASLERSYSRDVNGATTITGSINLGSGKNSGESTVAVWNLQENERRKTGVPDSVTTAILVRRAGDERFNAEVTLQADVDWVTGWERRLSKIPLDDPILFNPRETGGPGKKGGSYGAKDLASVDLNGLCKVGQPSRVGPCSPKAQICIAAWQYGRAQCASPSLKGQSLVHPYFISTSRAEALSVATMAEIVVPEAEKRVLEIQTAVDEKHDQLSQKSGLIVIQDGEQEPSPDDASNHEMPIIPFDVVLIHGIYGSSPESWTSGSDTIWINKALAGAQTESKGQIMSYGYHTDIETGRYYTPSGVYREAEALLEALRKLRTSEITGARRPIHFFAHDVGGTIMKAALAMASDRQDKYGDVLYCTRAMYFFGYPHRNSSIDLLEEAVLRLMTQQHQKWSGHMVEYAKGLTKTIIKVNDAFLGTQMLTQANFINVVSNLHLDQAQQVFPLSMSTMATPFERVVKMEKANCDLILPTEDGFHPVNDIADADWLMGGFTDEEHVALRKIINQASPVLPYQNVDENWQNPDLLDLPKRKETMIMHMSCSSGAETASENASFFLDQNRSGTFHPLLYMKFDARDTRFDNCGAMMRTFLARIVCNRLQTESVASRSMDDLLRSGALHRTTLSEELETLRSAKGKQKLSRSVHRADLSTDMKSAIYVLGCFDECDESSVWFLSAMHKLLVRKEQRIKILAVTTKGTHGDRLIASALSGFPPEYVRSIDYHPEEPRPFPVDTGASKLTNKLGERVGTYLHRDVHLVLSGCASDHNLCELVIEWLGAGTGQITRTKRLLDKPLTPTIVFAAILEDVDELHRPRAKIILSWLLASYRPLRYDELRQVSSIVCLQLEGGKTNSSEPTDILRSFHGLLTSVNGEIQFKHPATRVWLESCHSAGDEDIWYDTVGTGCHDKVLQVCIDYMQHAASNSQGPILSLPYAIELWHKHWQRVKTSEKHVQDLFYNESVFQFWANSLFALPNAKFKSPPRHIKPLVVAAHLGLTTVVEVLLEKGRDQAELRGQALVEACRTGHVATIRLLIRSYTDGLDLDDEHLHEAVRIVSHSSNDEALEELISAVPEPPKTDPGIQESETSLEFTEIQEKTASQDDSSERSAKHDDEVKDLDPQKRVSSPLDWLHLGVSPNPPKGITPYDNSYIHAAAVNNHVAIAKLLVDAGASPTATDEQGYTPLQKAICWASGETVEFLLSNGASINDLD
ncbi:ankyrin 1 [Fusarium coicis]|nr:ankyrin 1 [Fusarium coicis]